MASLDADVPVYDLRTLVQTRDETRGVASRRVVLYPLAAFAVLAGVIAVFGLYGLLSHAVAVGTRETGIRLALGAAPSTVLRQTLARGLRPAWIGMACGLAAAVATTRALTSVLFGVTSLDVSTYLMTAGLVTVLAAGACFLPARRAARLDPLRALRTE